MVMEKMIMADIAARNAFNEVMAPYFNSLTKVSAKLGDGGGGDGTTLVTGIFEKLKGPIQAVVTGIFIMGTIYFIYKAVLAGIPYFNAENPQERAQSKDKLKNALIGAAFCLAGTVIINFLINSFVGGGSGWTIEG